MEMFGCLLVDFQFLLENVICVTICTQHLFVCRRGEVSESEI